MNAQYNFKRFTCSLFHFPKCSSSEWSLKIRAHIIYQKTKTFFQCRLCIITWWGSWRTCWCRLAPPAGRTCCGAIGGLDTTWVFGTFFVFKGIASQSWERVIFSASTSHKGIDSVAIIPYYPQDCPSSGVNTGAADPSPVVGLKDGETEMAYNYSAWQPFSDDAVSRKKLYVPSSAVSQDDMGPPWLDQCPRG